MKVEFVNHSSFVVDTHGVRLICDPWLDGAIFNDGWDLLARSAFDYGAFRDVTHIWFSHEHPDHFYPPNIRKIPTEHRRRITVLFQKARDPHVVEFCRGLDFKEVIELSPDNWYELAPGLRMLCRPQPADWGECDSWMCLKTDDVTLLNVNDCEVTTGRMARDLQRRVGRVDVLFTQFSFANWVGNVDDVEQQQAAAARKLKAVVQQIDVLRPRYVVPFASFVWFCHEENFYMNDAANKIGYVASHVREQTDSEVIIMYPADEWIVGERHDSEAAIRSWQQEYDSLASRPRHRSSPVTREQLFAASERFIEERRKTVNPLVAHLYSAGVAHPFRRGGPSDRRATVGSLLLLKAAPVRVWVKDHECGYELDAHELRPTGLRREECGLELSADSLLYCLRFPWGCETLLVNGRYQRIQDHGERAFAAYFKLGRLVHHGHQSLYAEAARTFLRRVKLRLLRN